MKRTLETSELFINFPFITFIALSLVTLLPCLIFPNFFNHSPTMATVGYIVDLSFSIGVLAFGLAACYVQILDRNEFMLQIPDVAKSLRNFMFGSIILYAICATILVASSHPRILLTPAIISGPFLPPCLILSLFLLMSRSSKSWAATLALYFLLSLIGIKHVDFVIKMAKYLFITNPLPLICAELLFLVWFWKYSGTRDFIRVEFLSRKNFLQTFRDKETLFSAFRPGFSLLTMMMRRTKSKLALNVLGRLNEMNIGGWVSSPFTYALLFLIVIFWGYCSPSDASMIAIFATAIMAMSFTRQAIMISALTPLGRRERFTADFFSAILVSVFIFVVLLAMDLGTELISPLLPPISFFGKEYHFSFSLPMKYIASPFLIVPFMTCFCVVGRMFRTRQMQLLEMLSIMIIVCGHMLFRELPIESMLQAKFPLIYAATAIVLWGIFGILLWTFYARSDLVFSEKKNLGKNV